MYAHLHIASTLAHTSLCLSAFVSDEMVCTYVYVYVYMYIYLKWIDTCICTCHVYMCVYSSRYVIHVYI